MPPERLLRGGGRILLESIVFTVCEHEYMNICSINYRFAYVSVCKDKALQPNAWFSYYKFSAIIGDALIVIIWSKMCVEKIVS